MSSEALELILNREEARAVAALQRAWAQISPTEDFGAAWRTYRPHAVARALRSQHVVATAGALAVPAQLAEQGVYIPSSGIPNVEAFVGMNGDGRLFEEALDGAPIRARALMKKGAPATEALSTARQYVAAVTVTMLADTARAVMQTQLSTRVGMVYVRQVEAGACSRCLILAGKVFRWNEGFLRHPRCKCTHFFTQRSNVEQIAQDPYEMFESMSREQQDRTFGRHNAEAIRDGADIYQVVNSRRGMSPTGVRTTEGITRHSAWRRGGGTKPVRLTPQSIYQVSRSKAEALESLREYGYILPAGQVPGGSIRGRALGMGRYRAQREAIALWDTAGIRDPRSIHTMTAAERRVADARWQLSEIHAGRNPFESSAVERRFVSATRITGRRVGPPLSPKHAASAEQNAQLWIAAKGEAVEYRRLARELDAIRVK